MIIVYILIFYVLYFIFRKISEKIKYKSEKLEELDGEFIFTFINRIRKKEIYFNINEVTMAILTRMFIKRGTFQTMNFRIFLVDGYNLRLRKKQDCLIFLKVSNFNFSKNSSIKNSVSKIYLGLGFT